MDHIKINNPIEAEFAMVPNALWQLPCSVTAKAIFAYLLSLRDQATVRVALIEKTLGIGRDKRRSAMRELEQLGFIGRELAKDENNRIVTRSLWVDTSPLLRQIVRESLPPEKPSVGSQKRLPPEKPTVGKPRTTGAENPHNRGGKPGPLYNTKTKTKPPAVFEISLKELGTFQRSKILAGQPCLVSGQLIAPGTPEAENLRNLLRMEFDAKKGGAK